MAKRVSTMYPSRATVKKPVHVSRVVPKKRGGNARHPTTGRFLPASSPISKASNQHR
jgi:hypothetical protein